jgi:lipopolysaccharide export system permease protein
VKISNPDTFEYVMPVEDLTGSTQKNRSPSNYALSEIAPAIAEQEQVVARVEQANVAQAAFGMLTGDFDALSHAAWKANDKEITNAKTRLFRLHTEPWRRWANGFSCLCFVMVGIPVAVRMRFSEFIASFFICFLPILIVYYPLLAVSVDQAKNGVFPPQAVWLGNIVLALSGMWLMRRVIRY